MNNTILLLRQNIIGTKFSKIKMAQKYEAKQQLKTKENHILNHMLEI